MKHISIEYAHIYTNQHIGEEHDLSLQILGEVKKAASVQNHSTSLVVLVDDYSFPDPTFNYDEFSDWLGTKGHKPDALFRESQLIPACDEVLGLVSNPKLKQQITDYIRAKRYPCSLFIAAWYFLRLGKLTSPLFPSDLVAEKLVNILPESFKPFEDMALEIIQATPYTDCSNLIDYKFLPGRLIA